MKQRRQDQPTKAMIARQLGIMQQIVAVLVSRAGGHCEIAATEIDSAAGDHCEMTMTKEGVVLHIHRRIQVVSSLN